MAELLHIAGELGWQAWVTLGVIAAMIVALLKDVARPEMILLGALGMLLLSGVLTPEQGFAGFANPVVVAIGALYVVAAGIQRAGALSFFGTILGGRSRSMPGMVLRIMGPAAAFSGFLNNTPVVAMLIPRIQQWAQSHGVAASKLLIPLSYASIVGGMTTLIGTSTNLVVSGLMQAEGYAGLGFFDLSWVGVPVALCVLVYFVAVGYRLLPDHGTVQLAFGEGLQDCLFEVRVTQAAPFVGQSVDEAGLRALGDAYLVHLRRGKHVVPASPEEVIQAGDELTFVGRFSMLDHLLRRPGLERTVSALVPNGQQALPLYEAVVAPSSKLVGKTLREIDFRDQYQGVVLAVQRKDERLDGALGRMALKPGDLLLIEAREGFDTRWNASRDEFYLVAPRRTNHAAPRPSKAPVALAILVAMVAAAATGLLPLATAALAAAFAMMLTGCLLPQEAREAINLPVLLVIAAALGLGQAVEVTGLAAALAHGLLGTAAGWGTLAVLVALYLSTNVLTELVTNTGAAVLMMPIALVAAGDLGIDPKAFAVTVAIAASASFMTPIGYQTNLMVMAAGEYRFKDFTKVGFPVSLIVMGVTIAVVYSVWM